MALPADSHVHTQWSWDAPGGSMLATCARALEVSTRVPLHPHVLRWWRDEGGHAIAFGSDAHDPDWIARGFPHATYLAEATGFRPGRDPAESWTRAG